MTGSRKLVSLDLTSPPRRTRSGNGGGSNPLELLYTHLSLMYPSDSSEGTDDELWQDRALCAQTDPEAFFPEKGGSTREAKKICRGCEVKSQCLEYALANDERFGIWGGLSERERRRFRRGAVS